MIQNFMKLEESFFFFFQIDPKRNKIIFELKSWSRKIGINWWNYVGTKKGPIAFSFETFVG